MARALQNRIAVHKPRRSGKRDYSATVRASARGSGSVFWRSFRISTLPSSISFSRLILTRPKGGKDNSWPSESASPSSASIASTTGLASFFLMPDRFTTASIKSRFFRRGMAEAPSNDAVPSDVPVVFRADAAEFFRTIGLGGRAHYGLLKVGRVSALPQNKTNHSCETPHIKLTWFDFYTSWACGLRPIGRAQSPYVDGKRAHPKGCAPVLERYRDV